jgi:hypothetical protein
MGPDGCLNTRHPGAFVFSNRSYHQDRVVGGLLSSRRTARPEALEVCVELPGIASAAALDVALEGRALTVRSTAPAPLPLPGAEGGATALATYALTLRLPYPVVGEEAVKVKFNTAKGRLSVVLKVAPLPAAAPPPAALQAQGGAATGAPLVEVLSSSEDAAGGGEEGESMGCDAYASACRRVPSRCAAASRQLLRAPSRAPPAWLSAWQTWCEWPLPRPGPRR